jgi:formylmethanofuran dehydrogenase subunit B
VQRADLRLAWPETRDLEALVTLHALQRRRATGPSDLGEPLSGLLQRLAEGPHVAFVHGPGLTGGEGGQRRALALYELARALSRERHVVTLALPRAAGTAGAQDALTWQTGYPDNVDLAGGHPELLATTHPIEDVDLALRIDGAAAPLAADVAEIALWDRPAGPGDSDAAVWIRTAAPGVETAGTAHRLDGVPLTLQAPLAGQAPSAAALLTRLLDQVAR